jgi:hypothetical protein
MQQQQQIMQSNGWIARHRRLFQMRTLAGCEAADVCNKKTRIHGIKCVALLLPTDVTDRPPWCLACTEPSIIITAAAVTMHGAVHLEDAHGLCTNGPCANDADPFAAQFHAHQGGQRVVPCQDAGISLVNVPGNINQDEVENVR